MNKRILHLPLKKHWFDLIKSGEKLEEYREMGDYWGKRFRTFDYDEVEFALGYPRKDDQTRRIKFKNPRLSIGTGKEEWGAVPGKEYYVISFDTNN